LILRVPGAILDKAKQPINETNEMTVEQLRAAYQAQPFQPFIIHLADGRNVPVQSPEFILTVPSGRTIVVAQPDDTLNIIDLLLVTDLEIKSPGPSPSKRRTRRTQA
jgi:hypothetical protein